LLFNRQATQHNTKNTSENAQYSIGETIITSRNNPVIKETVKLHKKSYRMLTGRFIIEGERLVFDAIARGARVNALFADQRYRDFDFPGKIMVSPEVMRHLSDTQAPQGILADVFIPRFGFGDIDFNRAAVICDGISDPGNLGTIIRTADAAGFGGVITRGCVDAFMPKVVRATMGSVFALPIVELEDIQELKNINIICTDSNAGKSLFDYKFKLPAAVVIGSEANGVSGEMLALCGDRVKIPMTGECESLNAAVSFGIIAYEIVKTKHK